MALNPQHPNGGRAQRENKEEIEAKISALSEASAGLAQKMSAEQAEAGQQEAEAGGSNEDNDAVEAEFEK